MAAERLEDFDFWMPVTVAAPPAVAMAAERLEDFDTRRTRWARLPLVAMAAERLEDFDGVDCVGADALTE